ncbi:hypothetical protein BEL04_22975 [Mucilaginibacter sp. PPCGB 2223]|uniref:hypothetical protein n=1 Tax=Mucilaginibacter sp. PPCGB 2223 TaxID=1886027 RepID=UPI0008260058|nr:hypothetical protein [Mucilaginibacter sp. PPCGB 2223]OCX50637.1 hypothetical protein BEL04_22975 [Mucilaginibacter sp. PPCGB 2223]
MSDNSFKDNGYKFVKGLVDDTSAYWKIMNRLVELGKGKQDPQVPGSQGFYKEPFFEKLLEHLLPDVEQQSGYKLYKTYSYARQYHLGEELKIHRDRHACEVTVSLCLGNEGQPWPLWLKDRSGQNHAFALEAGDAFIFKGIELVHWREPNTFGACSQVFLHYVDRDGPYAAEKDDLNRKGHQGY